MKMKLNMKLQYAILFTIVALVRRQCYINQNMKPVCISPPYVTTLTLTLTQLPLTCHSYCEAHDCGTGTGPAPTPTP